MAREYTSFLVRCWRLSDGERRIEIEHIQSGDRTRVASLADGVAWVAAQLSRTSAGARDEAGGARQPGPGEPVDE